MAKGSKQIKNFAGGLNTYADPRDIRDNEFQALDNVSTDENARIRLSGGFEKKEITGEELQSISFGRPSPQIASIYSDFKPVSIDNNDFSLSPTNEIPAGWNLDNGNANNIGWTVGALSGNGSGRPVVNEIGTNTTANNVVDMGSITSSNFKLEPGETYKIKFGMICNNPFFYTPEAELPRARIINNTLGKYISGTSIFEDVDEFKNTAPQLIPKATSNLCIAPDSSNDTTLTWSSYPNWNAGSNMTIEREEETHIGLQGYMGTGTNYVLKCDTNASYTTGTYIYTSPIDISSYFSDTASDYKMKTTGKQLYFDCIYKTEPNQGTYKIIIYDETNSSVAYEKNLTNSNSVYKNLLMGVSGFENSTEHTNTLRGVNVELANNCTSISIRIYKNSNGTGTVKFSGFRLYPRNPVNLGGTSTEARVGVFKGGYTTSWRYNVAYPNTWNQDTKPVYVTSAWSNFKIESLSNERMYYFNFTVPENFENSEDWQISFNAGKWGASHAISNLKFKIYSPTITRISGKTDVNDSHYILVPKYDELANNTYIVGYQYNSDSKKYEKFPDVYNESLPIFSGKAYVNFTTIFGRTFISNGDFKQETPYYTFFYDNLSSNPGYKTTSGEQFVPTLDSVQTVAGSAMQQGSFNGLNEYVNRAGVYAGHVDYNDNEIEIGNQDFYAGGYTINTRSGLKQKWCNSLPNGTFNQSGSSMPADVRTVAGDGFHITSTTNSDGESVFGTSTTVSSNIRFPHPTDQNIVEDDYPAWDSFIAGNTSRNDKIHKLMEWTSGILDGTTNTGSYNNTSLEGPIKKIEVKLRHKFYMGGLAVDAIDESWHWAQDASYFAWHFYNTNASGGGAFSGSQSKNVVTHGMNIDVFSPENNIGETFIPGEVKASERVELSWDMNSGGDNHNNDYGIPTYGMTRADDPDIIGWTGTGQGYEFTGTITREINFEHGELPIDSNIALKFTPDGYSDAWSAHASRVHYTFFENGGTQSGVDSDTMRGIRNYNLWEIIAVNFYGYDSEYDTSNVLNLNDEQVGLNIEMGTNAGTSSEWVGTWYVKLTTVNYFDEESPLGEEYQQWSNDTNGHAPTMVFQMGTAIDFDDNLIKEVKIYMKESSSANSTYKLQLKVDLLENKMYAVGNGESVLGAVYSTDEGNEVLAYVMPRENLSSPNNIDSYTQETGLLESEAKNQAMMSAQWRTSAIVNNRMYIGNIMQEGKIYADRMIKSEKNKFGIFPRKNWIDVVINDGDEIVSLQSYMDKLLQFKHRKLFIINVANEQEGEFLEQTIDGIGIHDQCQITKTIHGICWINERGLFIYDGRSVNNLIEDKLAVSKWKDTISGWDIRGEYVPILGYDTKSDKLIILPTGFSSNDIYEDNLSNENNITNVHTSDNTYRETWRANMAYIYDFQRQSFTMNYAGQRGAGNEVPYYLQNSEENSLKPFHKVPPITGKRSDFYYDINGNLSILTDGEISPGKFVYNDIPSATPGLQDFFNDRNMRIITKDYDFGDPAVRKKVHKVYVTFKSTNKETTLVENANLTKDFYASSFVKVYYAIDGSNNWKEFDSNKSKNYDATKGLIDEKSENTTTLTNAITSTDTNITVGSTSNILEDYVIKIGDEHMLVENVINSTTLNVKRGYGYTADDENSYTLLQGIDHDASSVITISNGDWIQAELIPKESLNNIKSLKLMFVQAKIETPEAPTIPHPTGETVTSTYLGEELVNFNESLINHAYYRDAGTVEVVNNTTFSWTGVGNSNNPGYTHSLIHELLEHDDLIGFGEKAQITLTVSNYTDLSNGSQNFIKIAGSIADAAKGGLNVSANTGLNLNENGTRTVEWTRPPFETWGFDSATERLNGTGFYLRCGDGCTATVELNIKKEFITEELVIGELINISGIPGNVPKGFQINDISIIHRTKNVR